VKREERGARVPGRAVLARGDQRAASRSTLIPSEEVVFFLYEGPSEAAVRQLSERAGIPVSRIVEAITIAEG
jgi:Protein of unknown function (DUF4242)